VLIYGTGEQVVPDMGGDIIDLVVGGAFDSGDNYILIGPLQDMLGQLR
jgi:hypothetical protein